MATDTRTILNWFRDAIVQSMGDSMGRGPAVLHLLSNYRWTERAEPAANLALAEKQCGADVHFACGSPQKARPNRVVTELEARGLAPLVLGLPKHFSLRTLLRDASRLRAIFDEHRIGVIHAHMPNSHVSAAWARRGVARHIPIVRTCYEPEGLPRGLREHYLARRATDGLIVTTAEAQQTMAERHPALRDRIVLIEPGIDLERFSPDRAIEVSETTNLPEDAFVVGIVSRLRKDRRIDIAIEAVALLARDCPRLHLMVVGRGGPEELEEAVTRPLARAGCRDRVHMAGYKRGEDLVAAYRRMHVLAYAAPGTDKSCRTVREAMAAGVPVIGARVGYVPYLIEHETSGFVVDQNADAFAVAIRRVYEDAAFLQRLRTNALAQARERFSLEAQARRTLDFYRTLAS